MLTMALIGDVMLGRGVNEALRTKGPEEPWGDVLSLLEVADLRIINLECAITNHKRPWTRTPKVFHFRADPSAVEVLRVARVDGCSLANNHTLDFEEQGLLDTLKHLEAADISYAGAGRNREEAAQPALLEARTEHIRNRVALLAFTDNEPTFAAGTDRPGTNYLPVSLEPAVLARVEVGVTTARGGGGENGGFFKKPGSEHGSAAPRPFSSVRPCCPGQGRRHLLRAQRAHLPRSGDLQQQTDPVRYG